MRLDLSSDFSPSGTQLKFCMYFSSLPRVLRCPTHHIFLTTNSANKSTRIFVKTSWKLNAA